MNASLHLSYLDILPADLASTFAEDLRPTGVVVEAAPRPAEPQATIEWLIPTAVCLFITQKYVGTLIQEAAKEHYPFFKAALRRLVRRTTGPNREIRLHIVGTQGKAQGPEPMVFSVYVELKSGGKAKYCFEHGLAGADVEAAIDTLVESLADYQRADFSPGLAPVEASSPPSRWRPIVLVFDPTSGRWVVRF